MVAFDIHANFGVERSVLPGLSWICRKRLFIYLFIFPCLDFKFKNYTSDCLKLTKSAVFTNILW